MATATARKDRDGLAKNPRRVYGVLTAEARPMTAYELLDELRPDGVSAPLTVYRALKRLVADGLVHRLESLNAYVACANPEDAHMPAFVVCEDCGAVDEIEEGRAFDLLKASARAKGYVVSRMAVELIGRCDSCRAAGAA